MADEGAQGVLRQRRNLVAICSIVAIVELAEVSLKDLNLLGVHLNVGKPEVLLYAMWLALAYWLVRYWQYYNDHRAAEITERLRGRIGWEARERAVRQYFKNHEYSEVFPDAIGEPLSLSHVTPEEHQAPDVWSGRVEVSAQFRTSTYGNTLIALFSYKGLEYKWIRLRAWAYISWKHKILTEYYFPFLFAITEAYLKTYYALTGVSYSVWF